MSLFAVYSRAAAGRSAGSALLMLALAGACTRTPTTPAEGGAVAGAEAPPAGEAAPAPAPEAPALPPAREVLDRAARAMGDPEALARVESFYYRGTIEMVNQNIHGDLEIWWKKGDFFMEETIPGVGQMRAGKHGDEIWAEDPINGRRRLSGVEAEQHAWASSLLLAAEWDEYFDSAETIAERSSEGRTLYDVELSSASGLKVVMNFDAESGLQRGQSFEQITPMGPHPFEVTFEDYREVDGIKLAFRQTIDAKVQTVVQKITELELNAEVDPSRFGFPHTGDVVVQAPADAR